LAAAELQQRVGEFPAEPGVPVDTAWDIGIGDYTSIWCFQRGPDRIRLVHYIQDCGEGLPYYLNELSRLRALHGWSLAEHTGPHDGKVARVGFGLVPPRAV
jgi:phage terminase large subunit